jgi:hypothetical protein
LEDERTTSLVFDEESGVSEVFNHSMFPLDSGVGNVANLLTVEFFPGVAFELLNERDNVFWSYEIDECIPNVASVLEIDGKIEEVELTSVVTKCLQKHLLCILVRNVLHHQCGSWVLIQSIQ